MLDMGKANIMLGEAQRIAEQCGAVKLGVWKIKCNGVWEAFTTHYFNNDGREIGYYSHNMQTYNDTRTWQSDGIEGRKWDKTYLAKLEYERI